MKDCEYKYVSPTEDGYIEVGVSKNRLSRLVPNRKQYCNWKTSPRVYVKNDKYVIEWRVSKLPVVLTVLIYPVLLVLTGIANYKELNRDIVRCWNPEKYGSFSSDSGTDKSFVRKVMND